MKQEYFWIGAAVLFVAREVLHYFKALRLQRQLRDAEQRAITEANRNLHEWSEEAREAYEAAKHDNTNDTK